MLINRYISEVHELCALTIKMYSINLQKTRVTYILSDRYILDFLVYVIFISIHGKLSLLGRNERGKKQIIAHFMSYKYVICF